MVLYKQTYRQKLDSLCSLAGGCSFGYAKSHWWIVYEQPFNWLQPGQHLQVVS